MVEINGEGVTDAYRDMLWKMHTYAIEENSRNGKVLTIVPPVLLTIHDPIDRLLRDPSRNANPFFHAMEFVWMMAGSDDAAWIGQFNKQMLQYANLGRLRGAYGARWMKGDQIQAVIDKLRRDTATRQAVLSMWDPIEDNMSGVSDVCCNTHIFFRVRGTRLNMTVCNRSNDVVWGMLGANVVHMTLLQELITHCTGLSMGTYSVFSVNAHMYERHWPLIETRTSVRVPPLEEYYPLLYGKETYEDFAGDCRHFLEGGFGGSECRWMEEVAEPIYFAWKDYKAGNTHSCLEGIDEIKADDWRIACREWILRKYASIAEQDKSSGTTQNSS